VIDRQIRIRKGCQNNFGAVVDWHRESVRRCKTVLNRNDHVIEPVTKVVADLVILVSITLPLLVEQQEPAAGDKEA